MTAPSIPALLEPIQARLDAATPGPWHLDRDEPGDVASVVAYAHNDGVTIGTYVADTVEEDGDADFIANAPTDQARLLAAVQAVTALHKPSKRWEPYEGAGYTFLTREQALEAAGEEDLGVVAIEAGPQFFEVCAECARVESEQLSETGEEWGYREALWPCKTVAAVVAALGGEA